MALGLAGLRCRLASALPRDRSELQAVGPALQSLVWRVRWTEEVVGTWAGGTPITLVMGQGPKAGCPAVRREGPVQPGAVTRWPSGLGL